MERAGKQRRPRSDESPRRAPRRLFVLRICSTDEASRPADAPRCFLSATVSSAFVFLDAGRGRRLLGVFSRRILSPRQDARCQKTHKRFRSVSTPLQGELLPLPVIGGQGNAHSNCLFNYFSWMLHLHVTRPTPET